MAKTKQTQPRSKGPKGDEPKATAEVHRTDAAQARPRDTVAAEGLAAERAQVDQRRSLRLNMMRSIVTEPLLSQVKQNPDANFDVIISLNELFKGGIDAALRAVAKRADDWDVDYTTTSHYCFACLTGRQILELAEEARALTRQHGPTGSVIYRIWEDSEVSATLTRSLVTVKADAAQRSFLALGAGVVWAVLDSGVQHDHPHFKNPTASIGPLDTFACPEPIVHRDFTPDGRARR